MSKNKLNLTGEKFGRLVVLKEAQERDKYRHVKWVCKCDCGKVKIVHSYVLLRNTTKSCGCLNKENITKHGNCNGNNKSREYNSWANAKARCNYKKKESYKYYGGRGIKMCKEWEESFENFLSDMGLCPKGLTLERRNNNGNYEPNNCYWATWGEQANNKRTHQQILEGVN